MVEYRREKVETSSTAFRTDSFDNDCADWSAYNPEMTSEQAATAMRWYAPFLYLWASPTTLFGLLPLPLALLQGGSARVVEGVIEIEGGLISKLLGRGMPWVGSGGAAAMTLGHVVWGCNRNCLNRSRRHEHVHVRQYERWGPFFVPAYFIASLIAYRRGLDPYRDNAFEIEAYGEAP